MPDPSANIASWLGRHVRERPNALALTDETRRLTYAAFERRVARCAGALAARGIARGDRVALLLGNATPYLECVFAAARLGAIAVPLNARLTGPELAGLLADCTPGLLVSDGDTAAAGRAACAALPAPPRHRLESVSAYESALGDATAIDDDAVVDAEDPVILMYTSGTTGKPKGALLPHRKALYNARNAEIFFELSPDDRVLVVLPLFHSFGLKILSLPTLHAGGCVHLEAHFTPDAVWRRVEEERISFFGGVPTMFRALLDALESSPPPRGALASLRFLFTAGAAIPVEVIHGFGRHDLVLKQGFGQTETSILCCLDAQDALRKAGSVGLPVEHAELRLVRADGFDGAPDTWQEVAAGEPGEIVVRGPITMTGYWERPEATAETLRDGWLRTGDLATRDDEGFYTLIGRSRHMYISGGENVYPAEVEAVFEQHPSVREVAVVGVPDERWGEVGHAYCVPESGARIDADALAAWGSERLARFKLPARFIAVDVLPRTASGKVKKHELPSSP